MTIAEWFNSEPVQKFRQGIQGTQKLSPCKVCYLEEQHGSYSKRIKENQKSVIFSQAFDHSYLQSPSRKHFEYSDNGTTDTMPIDLHINLGNFCNLACKMCQSNASSTIASQEVKWGIAESKKYLGVDWTRNPEVWNSFKQQILSIQKLNNIHFMGGETLLTDRLEDLVDTMIECKKFDLCFSFVTNGTVFKPELVNKLKQFKRVGIEISIETVTDHNAYQRQGTNTVEVLKNIQRYQELCNNSSVTVTLRSAPSLLSIGYYHTLLEYALEHKLLVRSNLCYDPKFLYAVNLPVEVKQLYAVKYVELISRLDSIDTASDFNANDPHNFQIAIKRQAEMCLQLLSTDQPADAEAQLKLMVEHCRKWDQVYRYDARSLYPELATVWDQYGY
jgi:pyruvate-formate lyase-activating enzyme